MTSRSFSVIGNGLYVITRFVSKITQWSCTGCNSDHCDIHRSVSEQATPIYINTFNWSGYLLYQSMYCAACRDISHNIGDKL